MVPSRGRAAEAAEEGGTVNRREALAVLEQRLDEAPLVRLAEAVIEASEASLGVGGRPHSKLDAYVEGHLRARAGRIRDGRLGVKKNS